MNVKRMSHLDEPRYSLPRAHLGGFLAHGLCVSRWALALCFLSGVLATGCRPNGPVQETPDAGAAADAGTPPPEETPDAGPPPPEFLVLARAQMAGHRPNLMLLVDTSGSMTSPMNPHSPSCQRNGDVCGSWFDCDPSVCPTRWSTLQATMEGFLSRSGTVARIGLATYPSSKESCGPSLALSSELPPEDKDDDATLQLKAQEARDRLLAISNSRNAPLFPQGGTPTGPSLHFLASRPELRSGMRQSFVLLVSDSAPNCNEAYPFPYPDPRCKCSLFDCSYAPDIGCIDRDNSVEAVRSLRAQGIKTIVIGYGPDIGEFSEQGRMTVQTFSAMAEEGGFSRPCTRDSDCGVNDTCNRGDHWCTRRFYQAVTGSELEAALQGIAERLSRAQCLVAFDAAPATPPELLTVTLDGQVLAPGADTWALTDEGVLFTGTVCQRLLAATPDKPVSIEVRTAL